MDSESFLTNMKSASEVSNTFNRMSHEYDSISDLWYSWLFSRLHYFIVKDVIQRFNPRTVLDVGSGTGFQSLLHASFGAEVIGVDIAYELLKVAKSKHVPTKLSASPLFPDSYKFAKEYNRRIDAVREGGAYHANLRPPTYINGDASKLPFADDSFDHVNCCGSTLSLIDNYDSAISEVSRVLRPGGTLYVEVEAKWNFDVLWTTIDALAGGRLGFDATLKEALEPFSAPISLPVQVNYELSGGGDSYQLSIRLFTIRRLITTLGIHGLKMLKFRSIHSVTNLIPSTLLDSQKPSLTLQKCFGALSEIEAAVNVPLPGCSIVILARKAIPRPARLNRRP